MAGNFLVGSTDTWWMKKTVCVLAADRFYEAGFG